MAKQRTRKKPHEQIGRFEIHGAFRSKAKAIAKAKRVGRAWIVSRRVGPGDWRYLVLTNTTSEVPF